MELAFYSAQQLYHTLHMARNTLADIQEQERIISDAQSRCMAAKGAYESARYASQDDCYVPAFFDKQFFKARSRRYYLIGKLILAVLLAIAIFVFVRRNEAISLSFEGLDSVAVPFIAVALFFLALFLSFTYLITTVAAAAVFSPQISAQLPEVASLRIFMAAVLLLRGIVLAVALLLARSATRNVGWIRAAQEESQRLAVRDDAALRLPNLERNLSMEQDRFDEIRAKAEAGIQRMYSRIHRIPGAYHGVYAMETMMGYLANGRAMGWTECVNLYHAELHERAMQIKLDSEIERQRTNNAIAMDAASRALARAEAAEIRAGNAEDNARNAQIAAGFAMWNSY